jgi:RimJ/RimL family protein N-acetyltransferase
VWRRATGGSVMPCLIEAALDYCNFVLAHEGGRLVAVFLLTQQGTEAADVHLAFSPRAWGRTVPILRAFVAWCWTHTEYSRLVGPVPAHNRLARQLGLRAGFVELNEVLEIRKP